VFIRDYFSISVLNLNSGFGAVIIRDIPLEEIGGNKMSVEVEKAGSMLVTTLVWEGKGASLTSYTIPAELLSAFI